MHPNADRLSYLDLLRLKCEILFALALIYGAMFLAALDNSYRRPVRMHIQAQGDGFSIDSCQRAVHQGASAAGSFIRPSMSSAIEISIDSCQI